MDNDGMIIGRCHDWKRLDLVNVLWFDRGNGMPPIVVDRAYFGGKAGLELDTYTPGQDRPFKVDRQMIILGMITLGIPRVGVVGVI
jgi:hypothetical protein